MPRVLRPVRPEEMTVDKGEPENQLRRDVLGLFPDDQSVRDHLPAEWTPEAVRAFGAFLLAKSQPPLELASYGFVDEKGVVWITHYSWIVGANLLAYVTTQTPDPLVAKAGCEVFDQLWARADAIDQTGHLKGRLVQGLCEAVIAHGASALLTENFWKSMESGGRNQTAVVEAVGTPTMLDRLRHILRNSPLQSDRDTAALMEAELEFPELKRIKNPDSRMSRARRLISAKTNPKTSPERVAQRLSKDEEDPEIRQVFIDMAERLSKKPAGKP